MESSAVVSALAPTYAEKSLMLGHRVLASGLLNSSDLFSVTVNLVKSDGFAGGRPAVPAAIAVNLGSVAKCDQTFLFTRSFPRKRCHGTLHGCTIPWWIWRPPSPPRRVRARVRACQWRHLQTSHAAARTVLTSSRETLTKAMLEAEPLVQISVRARVKCAGAIYY